MRLIIVKDQNAKQINLLEAPDQDIPACSTVIYGAEGDGSKTKMGLALCDAFHAADPEEIIKGLAAARPLERVKGIIEVTYFE